MAAVNSAEECSLQSNKGSLSPEYKNVAAQKMNIDPVRNSKATNAKNTDGEMALSPAGLAFKAQDHADGAAVSAVKIKVEQAEEEECVIVHVDEAGDADVAVMSISKGDSSGRGESVEGDWPFRCEDCSETFGNEEEYLEHRSEHIHDGPIVCLDTDSQWDHLLISTDGGRRTLFCGLCGQKFSSSKGFFNHQMKHRNQAIKRETGNSFGAARQKIFECKDCGKTYSTIGQCLNHERSHKQASKSVFHQIAHLKKKSFQCPTCGRCYSRASALDAHRRCHEVKLVKSKTFETEKTLSLNEALAQDQNNGTSSEQTEEQEQKIFQCFCGRSFRTMCGLGTHQRFSTSCSEGKVKEEIKHPFVCSECGKTFISSVALLCHQRWHKRREQLVCNNQSYKCSECDRVFTSLTFYNKHQRLAHSEEQAAKSFLHQVIQLKKKAFECQQCGRRFSRASALQSHQLCHTDAFFDIMEKKPEMSTAIHTVKVYQKDHVDSVVFQPQDISDAQVQEKDINCNNTVEEHNAVDADYEVVHITSSDDSESTQDPNPDLELVCESDQEEKDDLGLTAESTSSLPLNPAIDVKIVQIDYEHLNEEPIVHADLMSKSRSRVAKYDCPHCDRKFFKASSLRCHVLWHKRSMRKKADKWQKFDILSPTKKVILTCEVCGHESPSKSAHYFHMGKHEDKVACKSISYQLENLQKNNIKCEECGMCFSRLSALHSHQQLHSGKKKHFACLQCERSYATASGLYNHQKVCCGDAKDEMTKHFNPTKTLLGPKVHHCKKCGKGFWSMGAFCHHKQNNSECADVETRPASAVTTENGHIRRKKRGRRGGYKKVHPMNSKVEHKCEVCGKSYHMLACFLKHKLVHDAQGLRPAVKSFDYQVQQLKKNSYQCPDCGKVFSRAMALQFHMKSHGFETGLPVTDPGSSERPQCPKCYSFFASESLLQDHQKHCLKPEDNVEPPQEHDKVETYIQDASSQKSEDVGEMSHSVISEKEQKAPPASNMKYKCKDCSRSFSVIGALNFHKRIHRKGHQSKKIKSYQAKPLKLGKVKAEKCSAKSPFICAECGRHFRTNSALGTHKRWHKDKTFAKYLSKTNKVRSRKSMDGGPYLCNLCGKGFFYLCVLRRHQLHHPPMEAQPQKDNKVAESNDLYTCPDCQMSFSTGSLLTTHFADHHSKTTETEKQSENVPTEELDSPIKQSYTYKLDITNTETTQVQHYQCPHCPKSFLNIRGLRAHKWQKHNKVSEQATASQEEPLVYTKAIASCEMPKKKELKPYTEEESVQCSRNVELAKCLFRCNKCAKSFPSEDHLNAHKAVAKTRPHCCALCCRGYWTENQLQQHLAWHNEVRQRLPTELRYRLSASIAPGPSDNLQTFSQRSESIVDHKQANSHKCPHCGKTFLSPRALQQHQTLHKNEKLKPCSSCSQTFTDLKSLTDHHQECLGGKELKDSNSVPSERDTSNLTCTECGIYFKQETELHQHYIEHAQGL
ncbi:zinc finger protein 208 [Danio aesculapii]|uniref:zinc finger protein 208 n=1 Tax=Danio aesculapii TaxID=1142201 RepID=UPI0024BFD032|nr:zinc finger protein 208 [Danio aesculapii]